MARAKKPLDVGRILIPLTEPKAVLIDVADVTRVLSSSKCLLVDEEVLAILRAKDLIYPFREVDPQRKTLMTTITAEGLALAQTLIEKAQKDKRYKQLHFDDRDGEQGDALSSEIV
jgi:hypothetical protein